MFIQKEQLESTKKKISFQKQEIESLYNLNPNLKEKENEIFTGDQAEKDSLNQEIQKMKENIEKLKYNYIKEINQQNNTISQIEKEIKQLKLKINTNEPKKIKTNITSCSLKKNLSFQKSLDSSDKKIKRPKSIESKTKRKPFNNFIFI